MQSKRSLGTRFSLSSAGFHFRLFTISAQMTRLRFPSSGPAPYSTPSAHGQPRLQLTRTSTQAPRKVNEWRPLVL